MLIVLRLLVLLFTLSPTPIKAADPPPPGNNVPVRRYNSDFRRFAIQKDPLPEQPPPRSSSVENLGCSSAEKLERSKQFCDKMRIFIDEQGLRIKELQRRLEQNKK